MLRIAGRSIQALDGKVVVLNIPASQVQAITYDDDLHRPIRERLTGTLGVVSTDFVRQALADDVRDDWTGIKAAGGIMCAFSGTQLCR